VSLYLLLDLAAVAGPIALSFDRRVRYVNQWPAALAAALLTAVPFVAWDWYMTMHGAWSFNPRHVLAPRVLSLPLEEILFFVVVPFSCLFLYEVLGAYVGDREARPRRLPWLGAAALCAGLSVAAWPRLYTSTILAASALFLAAAGAAAPRVLARQRFWLAILISYGPFLLMNGVLTAVPVVLYAPAAILGARLYTIPVEDFLYSFAMLGTALVLFSAMRRRA
jgi:lycopene cyclase domain-containing protein